MSEAIKQLPSNFSYQSLISNPNERDVVEKTLKRLIECEEIRTLFNINYKVDTFSGGTFPGHSMVHYIFLYIKKYGVDATICKIDDAVNNGITSYAVLTIQGLMVNKMYEIGPFKLMSTKDLPNKRWADYLYGTIEDQIYHFLMPKIPCAEYTAFIFPTKIKLLKLDLKKDSDKDLTDKTIYAVLEKAGIYLKLIPIVTRTACILRRRFDLYPDDCLMQEIRPTSETPVEINVIPENKEIDVDTLCELYDNYEQFCTSQKNMLDAILSRYNHACSRWHYSEQAIAFRSVLESIFTYERDRYDSFRNLIGMRGAFLLGNNYIERRDISQRLKKAYDFSSAAVHECEKDRMQYDKKNRNIVEDMRILCSQAIMRIIETGKIYTDEDWQQKIFGMDIDVK